MDNYVSNPKSSDCWQAKLDVMDYVIMHSPQFGRDFKEVSIGYWNSTNPTRISNMSKH